jgi:hypothetical protein
MSKWIGLLRWAGAGDGLEAGRIWFDWVPDSVDGEVDATGWHLGIDDSFHVADVDGDGREEIIAVSANGQWIGILRERDGALVCTWIGRDWVNQPGQPGNTGWDLNRGDTLHVADVDGDGREEIIAVSANGQWIGILRERDGALVCTWIGRDWVNHPGQPGNTGWALRQDDVYLVAGLEPRGAQQLVVVSPWRMRSVVVLHLKVLVEPAIARSEMISAVRDAFHATGVGVEVESVEYVDTVVGSYPEVAPPDSAERTSDELMLLGMRGAAAAKDVVVYFVGATLPPMDGLPIRHEEGAAVLLTHAASRLTLAHEIGHVAGLGHPADELCGPDDVAGDRLMTGCGTAVIGVANPQLTPAEIDRLKRSDITQNR